MEFSLIQPIWRVIMNLTEITYMKIKYIMRAEITYTKIKYIIRKFKTETKRKPSCRNSAKFMLNQSKEVLYFYVSFQESRDSINEEPEANISDMSLSCWRRF